MRGRTAKVVDFNEFKAARTAGQLDLLATDAAEKTATPEPPRALSESDVAHRARMLAHLKAASSSTH